MKVDTKSTFIFIHTVAWSDGNSKSETEGYVASPQIGSIFN